jgi:hypothetical protein
MLMGVKSCILCQSISKEREKRELGLQEEKTLAFFFGNERFYASFKSNIMLENDREMSMK